jgi:hypothetical protein
MYRTKIERNFQAVGTMTLFLLPVKCLTILCYLIRLRGSEGRKLVLYLVAYDIMSSGMWLPLFRRNTLLPPVCSVICWYSS